MAKLKNNSGVFNVNAFEDKGKYDEGTTFLDVFECVDCIEGTEKKPDFRGKMLIDGETFFVSGWKKESRDYSFISLSITSESDVENRKKETVKTGKGKRSTKK